MASVFTFRFETLLRLRRRNEDRLKRVVADRLRTIGDIQRRKDLLSDQIHRQTEVFRGCLSGGEVQVDELRWGRHWLSRLRRGVLQADAEIAAHRAILAQERSALVGARKESKVLARLKERQWTQHLTDRSRAEQAALDEMNTSSFAWAAMTQERH